ncbi:MAG TPA: hypothetical protein VFF81_05270 [Noviherbaspirillum sp.]|nr:hypothetical protein [Noviherbaspirillum sp.]
MSQPRFSLSSALMRAAIGSIGGFALALSFMAGTTASLVAMRWATRADAVVMSGMLAFVLWAAAVLFAFAAASVRRAALWVLGSGAGFALLGWTMTQSARAA